jgi:hypothetical protein
VSREPSSDTGRVVAQHPKGANPQGGWVGSPRVVVVVAAVVVVVVVVVAVVVVVVALLLSCQYCKASAGLVDAVVTTAAELEG